jgi:hypothetical protein
MQVYIILLEKCCVHMPCYWNDILQLFHVLFSQLQTPDILLSNGTIFCVSHLSFHSVMRFTLLPSFLNILYTSHLTCCGTLTRKQSLMASITSHKAVLHKTVSKPESCCTKCIGCSWIGLDVITSKVPFL